MTRILLLGGTVEARTLAENLATTGHDAVYSYAGRTAAPVRVPLPTRIGGFGGIPGLIRYIREERITHVIDATHPFAAGMSGNAVAACAATDTHLCALERPAWIPGPGDRWKHVADIPAAVAVLPRDPKRVFLAIGRQHLAAFAEAPQHEYLLRLVDEPTSPLPLPRARAVIARGPFTYADDLALLRTHRIEIVVAKNGGSDAARAKLDAARTLGLRVVMIDRPAIPPRHCVENVADCLDWLAHTADRGV